jgi:RimJ/RimL family protein N-acetyltransferase
MELRSERILLRDFAETDVGALYAIHSHPRVLRFYAPEIGTLQHAQMLVDTFIGWAHESPRRNFQFAIVEPSTNALLGSCGIRSKEFGIGIHPDWWGKGIAQEAARTILRFGFLELNLNEIHGVSVSQNEAVSKFVRRLGFIPGAPRQGDTWMSERGWSAVDWVITREKWEQHA